MKIDHVGIAVQNLEEAIVLYCEMFRLTVMHREEVVSQNVRVAFLGDGSDLQAPIELLEPTGNSGAVARFISSRGPGMHHLAFKAEDLAMELKRLASLGRPAIEPQPRPGSRGRSVCFVHPRHAGGVLVELVG